MTVLPKFGASIYGYYVHSSNKFNPLMPAMWVTGSFEILMKITHQIDL